MNWPEYHMAMARQASRKSKDPSTKVGCVVTDRRENLVSSGYNGFPRGCLDDYDQFSDRKIKYPRTVHAEANAILSGERDKMVDARLYVNGLHPCAHCAGLIINAGITEVFYTQDPNDTDLSERWAWSIEVARGMFSEAGIKTNLIEIDS